MRNCPCRLWLSIRYHDDICITSNQSLCPLAKDRYASTASVHDGSLASKNGLHESLVCSRDHSVAGIRECLNSGADDVRAHTMYVTAVSGAAGSSRRSHIAELPAP
jgi:hypothetical protein